MARALRAVLLIGFLAAVAPSTAAAEGPTLGGRLTPVPLVYERDRQINVTSLATIPVAVTLSVAGDGWQLATNTLTLQPQERESVDVTAAGKDDATVSARFSPAEALPGVETQALVLTSRLRHEQWYETFPWGLVIFLAAMAIVAAGWLYRRYRRRTA